MKRATRVIAWIAIICGTTAAISELVQRRLDPISICAVAAGRGILRNRAWGWWALVIIYGVSTAVSLVPGCVRLDLFGLRESNTAGILTGVVLFGAIFVLLLLDRPSRWRGVEDSRDSESPTADSQRREAG